MDAAMVIYIVLEVLIGVCCCLGNLLVILSLWTSKNIRLPTFCLIISLAAADFFVGCVSVPLAVMVDGTMRTSPKNCLFMCCVVILLTVVSILSLTAIAVDRYLRVYIPLSYKTAIRMRHSLVAVAACWVLAVPLSFTPMLGWNNHTLTYSANVTIVCKFIDVIPMSYLVYFNFFLCTLTPLLVMFVLYACVFYTIRGNRREKPGYSGQKASPRYLRKEKHLATSLFMVLGLFALSWIPLHILNCISYFSRSTKIPVPAFYIGIILTHANSAVNPVIYAFKIRKIREGYLVIWQRFTTCTVENQVSYTSRSTDNNLSGANSD